MTDPHSCDPACLATCSAPCAVPAPPITLAEAQQRFEKEAIRGVCDTSRYRCSYSIWGEGPPLVFLHGLADSSQAFVMPMALLSRFFRCIAYDLPNGRDDGARLSRYTHAHLVEDLWALLDQVGAKQCYVFATSFGSTIALSAMHEQPQRLPRAILQAPVACKPLSRTERVFAWLMSHLPGSIGSLPLRRRLMHKLHYASFDARPPELWQHFLTYTGAIPTRAVGRQARMLHRVDLRGHLKEIRQPILLIRGELDPIVSDAAMDALLLQFPNAGRGVMEGCGHVPSFTHPEALTRVIRLFLTPPTPCREPGERMHLADCKVVSGPVT